MTATGAQTYHESDGKAVEVTLTATVAKDQVAYVQGWLGLVTKDGVSGENTNLTIDEREYQFTVPSALAVAKGDIVYIDVTDLTGHTPDDSAYSKTAGSNKIRLFKATAAQDGNNMVTGIMLVGRYMS